MKVRVFLFASAFLPAGISLASQGAVTYGFETGDLMGWRITEGAFDRPVSDRAREFNSGRPYAKEGKWFLTTLERRKGKTDGQTGVIESPVVRLSAPEIVFRVGGGSECRFFLVDRRTGGILASAAGANSEKMREVKWTVPEAVGKDVFFRVTDFRTGSWGHITVDAVKFTGSIGPEDFDLRKAEARAKTMEEDRVRAKKILKTVAPLLGGEVLYVTHDQYVVDHHNTATLFQCGEINARKYRTQGAMKAWDPRTDKVRVLVPEIKGRTVRNPDVSYDGRTIVFSMRNGPADGYHVYTVNADGSGLRQLTSAPGVSDIDPVWLPDGDIVFASTREPKYCMCNRHIMCNLFRMKPDGSNIHQIGKSTLFEGHPRVMSDGRILYDRWEYVDRNFGDAQGLWTCNPDGTNHQLYWGNNTTSPGGVINARELSGPSICIAVLGSCHDRPWGALGIIDRSAGLEGRKPVLWTHPASFAGKIEEAGRKFDSTVKLRLKYADPYPLNDDHFLCTRMLEPGSSETVLCYVGRDGSEVVLLRDGKGIHNPVVLAPRKRPPVIATRRNFEGQNAVARFYLHDVYAGTHMKGVRRGTVKSLRIVESPPKRNWSIKGWFGDGEQAPAMNWHNFENKRILGTVPVEEDGSAYFEVPGNTFLFFQALDAEGKMVQSMRSGAYLQPGEIQGCVGCHESRLESSGPAPHKVSMALKRAPSKLTGWRGKVKLFSFREDVQPVFDRSCVSCHDYGKPAGKKLNLSGDRGLFFNTAYSDLWALGMIKCIGGGPAEIQQAYSWGSHASKLTKKLYGHGGAELTDEERDTVITWIDLNAPYYPTYDCAYPINPGGRGPISMDDLARVEKLSGVKVANKHYARQREWFNFDRPGLSRILDGPSAATNRNEILSLIVKGRDALAAVPRADSPGFRPCKKDEERNRRFLKNFRWEDTVYSAIREGRSVSDIERK